MSLIVPEAGALNLLDLIRTGIGSAYKIKLFKNNYTPISTTVVGDVTEANFNGYTAGGQTCTFPSAAVTTGGRATATGTPVTWTKAAGGTGNDIYGYYVTNAAGTVLVWAERAAAAPLSMNSTGEGITVTPVLTEKSEF